MKVVQNACATQAIISILMNVKHPDIDLGTVVSEIKDFGMSLDPVVCSCVGVFADN